MKKKPKSALIKVPKRFRPFITENDLALLSEAELMNQLDQRRTRKNCPPKSEQMERQPGEKQLKSENYDILESLKVFLSSDCIHRGSLLESQLAACLTTNFPLDTATSLMKAVRPKSTLEVLLLVQMLGTHTVGMHELSRAAHAKDHETSDLFMSRAIRLLRLFGQQMEVYDMLRSKGRRTQRVIVKHVSVIAGQAVVGVRQDGAA